MELYTSSWRSVYRHFKTLGEGEGPSYTPVRTSVGQPRFFPRGSGFPYVRSLSPYKIRSQGLEGQRFDDAYVHCLDEMGIYEIREELMVLSAQYDNRPLVLLCFEHDRNDCHRGRFATWWEEKTGEIVPELRWSDEACTMPILPALA
jgi:hypothetical protein